MKFTLTILLAIWGFHCTCVRAQTASTQEEQLRAYEQQLRPAFAATIGQSGYSLTQLRVMMAQDGRVDIKYDFLLGNDYLILAVSDTQAKLDIERYRPGGVRKNLFDGSEYEQERQSLDTATGIMQRRKLFETEDVQREGLLVTVPPEYAARPVIIVIGYRSKDNAPQTPDANYPENYYIEQ
jgi:hypothetical protein